METSKIGKDGRFVKERVYNIQALWEKHREITRQVVLGRTNMEIAETVGCSPQTVSNVRNSPIAQSALEEYGQRRDEVVVDIAQRIAEFAPVALRLLEDVITGAQPGASLALRTKIASSHLARAGHGEVQKVHSVNTSLSRSDIEDIKRRAVEAARAAGVVVEGESTHVE
jgi:hypothetical protein